MMDRDSIRACALLCRALFGELVEFDLRNGPLRRKFDGVKYDVRKIDDILYELSLVGQGGGGGRGGGGETGGEAGRKREREEKEGNLGEGGILDKAEFRVIREAMAAFDEKR